MNLHLMLDEKIIERAILYFDEALPGCNKYIVLLRNEKEAKKVKINAPNVFYLNYGTKDFWRQVGNVKDYKYIILHGLSNDMVKFVNKNYQTNNWVWVVWGADLYNSLLAPKGFQLYAYPEEVFLGKLNEYFPFLYKIRSYFLFKRRLSAVKKIPTVAMANGDYKLLIQYFPFLNLKRKEIFYYPVNDMVNKTLMESQAIGDNIFVGNSASFTNNHRLVFESLSKYNLGTRKVIAPLSYGPSPKARELATRWGRKLLKDNFYPLVDFLPLDEYNKLMLSSSLFIYGNYRQEACGNILVALYIGGIVVLESRNPFMQDLLDMGFKVFSTEELDSLINYKLPDDIKRANRDIVEKLYSRERMLSVLKSSFQ